MTEKLTCGRLSTCELCSRCLLHLERPLQLPARVAPPPFAPLRGAPSRTDWLGASGRHAEIRCGCRMVAYARSASRRGRPAYTPTDSERYTPLPCQGSSWARSSAAKTSVLSVP